MQLIYRPEGSNMNWKDLNIGKSKLKWTRFCKLKISLPKLGSPKKENFEIRVK